MVAEQDLDFCLLKLEEGVRTGAHGLLRPGVSKWLAPTQVVTAAEKLRLVIDYRQLNDACKRATCRYESIDDLVKLVTPSSWLLSCFRCCLADVVAEVFRGLALESPVGS